ncbi:PDZ and LIM domain protein 2 [Thelohanellus kitauei]|uniref:PDZ and LIM domain protein 2 n=1 Tax=Thelohanellus kitauei TaxID=669202 RepID=A0A0C2JF75_THEKT|nr:PDZ and LIM domain protein 2 [Thelohanellus kitauei]
MNEEIQISITEPGPYGLKIKGGKDFGIPVIITDVIPSITQVTPKGKADIAGVRKDMIIGSINGINFDNLTHVEAALAIKNAKQLHLKLRYSNHNTTDTMSKKREPTTPNDESKSRLSISRPYKNSWYKEFIQNMEIKPKNGFEIRNKLESIYAEKANNASFESSPNINTSLSTISSQTIMSDICSPFNKITNIDLSPDLASSKKFEKQENLALPNVYDTPQKEFKTHHLWQY